MAGYFDLECLPEKCRSLQHADYVMSCVTRESLQSLKKILKCKCGNFMKIIDRFGRNALHIAVSCGKYDVADWLINECGADVNIKDFESGWNALHRSLYYGNIHCAVLLLQHGLDFSVQDKDRINPLKLAMLDSQRVNSFRNEKIKLGRVILPYHASEPDELSLEINELVDILKEYKTTGWGFGRINGTKERGKFPLNFVAILGDRQSEFSEQDISTEGHQTDVYMWGNNSNLTLGQADAKSREYPELVESLSNQKYSIKQVAVSKYHTIFLSEDGSVFTCGQGRGGRLGHGNEQTILSPQKIAALNGIFCVDISNANDHSLVLDQMGQVYSFGLNTYHQLGHYPVPVHSLTPKLINNKSLRGKMMVGVKAARFHSAIYTKDELFTFGLNAGQLGHLKGDNWQSTPRLVSLLCKKDSQIDLVALSDGATCCLMKNGDIYLLQDYGYRRIATKMTNVKRLVMIGGELKSKVLADLQHNDPENMCVVLLRNNGIVQCWRKGYANFKECFWAGKKRDFWQVVDICLGKHLMIATDEGVVFHGYFRRGVSQNQIKTTPIDGKHQSSKSIGRSSLRLEDLVEKGKMRREEEEEIMIEKVPLLYRAYRLESDVKCTTFAAIQHDPMIGVKTDVNVSRGTLENDLKILLHEADLMDNVHDVIVKTKNGMLPAHRFILISRLKETDLESRWVFDDVSDKYVLSMMKIDFELVKCWLESVYIGKRLDILEPAVVGKMTRKQSKTSSIEANVTVGKEDGKVDEIFVKSMESFYLRDLENPVLQNSRTVCNENGNVTEQLHPSVSRKQKKKTKKGRIAVSPQAECKSKLNGFSEQGFYLWQGMDSVSDVKIEGENGMLFSCHKCVLIARLEYFRSMLGNPWMESNWVDRTIKMPIPSKILKIILDFIYLDGSNILKGCLNIEFLCQVIVYSDQLLISRLKEICEFFLAKQLTLKNSVDLLAFSCTYNAEQLKKICCEFICNNLILFLEMRILESVSPDVLSELSTVYKAMIPSMAYRKMTPSTYYLEQDSKNIEERKESENGSDPFYDQARRDKSPRIKGESPEKRRKRRRKSSSTRDSLCEGAEASHEGQVIMNSDETFNGFMDGQTSVKDSEMPQSHADLERQEEEAARLPLLNSTVRSPASGARSLREIMEEEEKSLDGVVIKNGAIKKQNSALEGSTDGAKTNVAIKWEAKKRKSQKQRKEEQKSSWKLSPLRKTTAEQESVSETSETVCPWASSGQAMVKSFREVMSEESQVKPDLTENQASSKRINMNGIRRKLCLTENKDKSAWSVTSLGTSPPSAIVSLSAIMKSQLDEKESSNKILKKPLQLIQIEEKAMEDLLTHYNAKGNASEYITVRRIKDAVASPIWNVTEGK